MAIINKNKIKTIKEDSYFDPRCCSYKLSGDIRNRVADLISSTKVERDIKLILENIMDEEEANKSTLTYESLVKLHKYIQRADRDYLEPFHIFVDDCKCIKPKARDNKQLDERLKLLRLKNSQAIYNMMAETVDRSIEDKIEKIADNLDNHDSKFYLNLKNETGDNNNSGNINVGRSLFKTSEFKKLNGSIVAVFNSFLVFICTFIFCYKALEYSLPEPNIIAQTLFGIAGSTIVAIAELYFLIRVV